MSGPTLIDAIEAMPPSRFAVIDGAHIADLPGTLRAARLDYAPLYLEAADEEGVRAGPYLVALPGRAAIAAAIAIVAGRPAATFWSWPGGLSALRRHLRGINLCEIPRETRAAGDGPSETVLFRHWDPNVIAVTLPVLDAGQRSRILGDAAGIVFDADGHAGVTGAMRPDSLPPRPRGMLRFSPEQMTAITARRIDASRRRIAAYLRAVAPIQAVDEPSLHGLIGCHAEEAARFGLTTERNIGRWTYLQIVAGGVLAEQPMVAALFDAPANGTPPGARLDALFDAVIDQARSSR